MQEVDVELVEVFAKLGFNLASETFKREHFALDPLLGEGEIILDAVEKAAKTKISEAQL
jgi:hypothetical protein